MKQYFLLLLFVTLTISVPSLATRNEHSARMTKLQYCKALERFVECLNRAHQEPITQQNQEETKCRTTFIQQVQNLGLSDADIDLCQDINN